MESAICKIFGEMTGAPQVGRDDDFFQIGGHSLAAVLCVHRLQREFNREVTLRQLFSAPTPEALARCLSNGSEHQSGAEEAIQARLSNDIPAARHGRRRATAGALSHGMRRCSSGLLRWSIPIGRSYSIEMEAWGSSCAISFGR